MINQYKVAITSGKRKLVSQNRVRRLTVINKGVCASHKCSKCKYDKIVSQTYQCRFCGTVNHL